MFFRVNDVPNDIKSEIKLFADDVKLLVRPLSKETSPIDLNELSYWKDIWILRFNIEKCTTYWIQKHLGVGFDDAFKADNWILSIVSRALLPRKVNLSTSFRSVSSTKKDIDTRLTKAWTAIDKLLIIWKSDLTDKMKRSFFQAAVVSILLYECTTRTLTKRLEKKIDGNYTRMLRAILNKSWQQRPTKHQLYGHLPLITKIIQVRQTRHAGHCRRSRDEIMSDVLLWTPTYGRAKAGWPARTYIQQLCEDMGCSPEDLPEAMNDREKWRERVKDIRASGTTWWWCIKGKSNNWLDGLKFSFKRGKCSFLKINKSPRPHRKLYSGLDSSIETWKLECTIEIWGHTKKTD